MTSYATTTHLDANASPANQGGRWGGVDLLKGLLMFLVIFGHTLPRPFSGDPLKWAIYAFHIPAFFFVSGFLVDRDRFLARSPVALIVVYTKRLVLPWVVASLLMLLLQRHGSLREISTQDIANFWFKPTYHLWFVPALLIMIVFTRAAAGSLIAELALFVASLIVALIVLPLETGLPTSFHRVLGDMRTYRFLVFYVFGYLLRNHHPAVERFAVVLRGASWALIPLGSYLYLARPGQLNSWPVSIAFLLINLPLLAWIAVLLPRLDFSGQFATAMKRVGQDSLWIYLVHPFITWPITRNLKFPLFAEYAFGFGLTCFIVSVALAIRWMISTGLAMRSIRPQPKSLYAPLTVEQGS